MPLNRRESALLAPVPLEQLMRSTRQSLPAAGAPQTGRASASQAYFSHPGARPEVYGASSPPPPLALAVLQSDTPEAAREVARQQQQLVFPQYALCIPLEDLEALLGRNLGHYFRFVRFAALCCAGMALPGTGLFVASLVYQYPYAHLARDSISGAGYDLSPLFYVASYPPALRWAWRACLLASGLLALATGLLYARRLTRRGLRYRLRDRFAGNVANAFEDYNADSFTANALLSARRRACGRLLSWAMFALLLAGEAAANYALVRARLASEADGAGSDTRFATLLSLVLAAFNGLWQLLCETATDLERPLNATAKFSAYFHKAYLFQMVCGVVLFSLTHQQWFGGGSDSWSAGAAAASGAVLDDSGARWSCGLALLAHEFLIALLVSAGSSIAMQYATVFAQTWLVKRCTRNRAQGNRTAMPEFLLGDEYTLVLYMLFLTYVGHAAFPMLPWVGAACLCVKYWADKLRLRLCKPVILTNNSFRRHVMYWQFFGVLLGTFLYACGPFWVWRGDGFRDNAACLIYQ